MGLNCKVCNKELDAFSGGRCRHCRQLVCSDCIAEGAANAPGGLLCKDCASHQIASAAVPEAAPAPVVRKVIRTPAWAWGLIAAVLGGAFLFVVVKPYVDDREMVGRVVSGTDEEYRQAMDDLSLSGGGHALDLLRGYVKTAGEPARSKALRAIGALPGKQALKTLQEMYDSPKTPADLRSVVYEALLEHVFRHPEEDPQGTQNYSNPPQLPLTPADDVPPPVPARQGKP